jgi:hypothetical protein
LKHSEDVYDWLTRRGFDSPVDSYAEYTRTSGPLTKTVRANGKNVTAKVWLFWGKPGTDTDPDTYAGGVQLEDDMRASFKDREVVIFSGHSGPFYGFALANWRKTDEGDLDDSEIAALDMPAGVYQVVLAEGCETYALGQAFFDNPNKSDRKFLDVITTSSFSNAGSASTVTDFLTAVIGNGFGEESPVEATTYMELLLVCHHVRRARYRQQPAFASLRRRVGVLQVLRARQRLRTGGVQVRPAELRGENLLRTLHGGRRLPRGVEVHGHRLGFLPAMEGLRAGQPDLHHRSAPTRYPHRDDQRGAGRSSAGSGR